MYENLIKKLRNRRVCIQSGGDLETDFPIMKEAADAIEELQKALDAVNDAHNEGYDVGYWAGRRDYEPRWISVTERLPEDDTICILTNGISDAIGCRGKVFGWHLIWTDYLAESDVTHWMPLPTPPKEETE